MQLTTENVRKIFLDCLHHNDEEIIDPVICDGIVNKVGFHPGRLDGHKSEIVEMLRQLPDTFKTPNGGKGGSFLNMCMDAAGEQWADMHQSVEQLVLLGMGIGQLSYCLPRELWQALPGGMPYIVITE